MARNRLEGVPTSYLTTVETEAEESFNPGNSESQPWQYSKTLPPKARRANALSHCLFLSNYKMWNL